MIGFIAALPFLFLGFCLICVAFAPREMLASQNPEYGFYSEQKLGNIRVVSIGFGLFLWALGGILWSVL